MQRWQKKKSQFPVIAFVFFVFIAFSILYNECNFRKVFQDQSHNDTEDRDQGSVVKDGSFFNSTPAQNITLPKKPPVGLDKLSTCSSTVAYSGRRAAWGVHKTEPSGRREEAQAEASDIFSGKWLACHKHGRPESGYQFSRWQTHNCNLKRWNATEIWEKLRGKRLMFVGDSLNRGQWISLLCLLQSVIPADKQSITPNAELSIFRAEAPLVAESNSDDAVDHRLDAARLNFRHLSRWVHADILPMPIYLSLIRIGGGGKARLSFLKRIGSQELRQIVMRKSSPSTEKTITPPYTVSFGSQ